MKAKSLTIEQINEAQRYSRIWDKITSRPFTSRELEFAKAVASAVEASWQPIETAPRDREVHTIDIHGNQRIAYCSRSAMNEWVWRLHGVSGYEGLISPPRAWRELAKSPLEFKEAP